MKHFYAVLRVDPNGMEETIAAFLERPEEDELADLDYFTDEEIKHLVKVSRTAVNSAGVKYRLVRQTFKAILR